MYSIEDFKAINQPDKMLITQHSRKRFAERQISINDICAAINNGKIIEQYDNDFPFPSCLILGNNKNKVIHVVASIHEEIMYIITAYIPNSEKWENNWETRKEKK